MTVRIEILALLVKNIELPMHLLLDHQIQILGMLYRKMVSTYVPGEILNEPYESIKCNG